MARQNPTRINLINTKKSLIASCLATTEARKKESAANASSASTAIKYAQYGGPLAAIIVALYAAIKIKNEREMRGIRER